MVLHKINFPLFKVYQDGEWPVVTCCGGVYVRLSVSYTTCYDGRLRDREDGVISRTHKQYFSLEI